MKRYCTPLKVLQNPNQLFDQTRVERDSWSNPSLLLLLLLLLLLPAHRSG
jgi:hypothetical protein